MPPVSSENKYKVYEIFYSLEGEATFAGAPAVFIRLSGCQMHCPWCDTKKAQQTRFRLTAKQILEKVKTYGCKTVVITGGEPTEQNLQPLFKILHKNHFEIHLETNGSIDTDVSLVDWCTVSPKLFVNQNMFKKANTIKLVTDKNTTLDEILSLQKFANKKALFFLQPKSNSKENTKKCLEIIKKYPVLRLSMQLHKLIKIK